MKIRHDIHCHTHLSLCGKDNATIAYYVRSARKLGLKLVGIADHMWDEKIPFAESMRHSRSAGDGENVLNWYRAQFIPHCREILDEIAAADAGDIRFAFGGEVDYCPGIGAAITLEEAEKLDFMIVPNSHTHHIMDKALYEPPRKHAEFMLRAAMEICTAPTAKYVTALAHPFDPVCCPYPAERVMDTIRDEEFFEVFRAAAEAGIAAEINTACYSSLPVESFGNLWMTHVLSIAKKAGCTFTFGSDAHSDPAQDTILLAEQVSACLGLTENDLHPFVSYCSAYGRQ